METVAAYLTLYLILWRIIQYLILNTYYLIPIT